jgi:hypothetical protein
MSVAEQIAPAALGPYLYGIGRKLMQAGQKELADEIMEKAGILCAVAKVGVDRCEARVRQVAA